MSKQRTITLTDRAPVQIDEDDWPVIARATWGDHDGGQHEFRANRRAEAQVRVRRHDDGRAIVYGTYDYRTNLPAEAEVHLAAGVLLPADAGTVAAIHGTVEHLASYVSLPGAWLPDWRMLADECIACLPPEKI